MILRLYVFSLVTVAVLSLGLWLLLIFNVNPFVSPSWIIGIFYATFFLFFMSLFATAGFYIKVWASNHEVVFSHLAPTLRQAIILSLAITGLLLLQQVGVLNWWIAVLFLASMIMLELFFRSKK